MKKAFLVTAFLGLTVVSTAFAGGGTVGSDQSAPTQIDFSKADDFYENLEQPVIHGTVFKNGNMTSVVNIKSNIKVGGVARPVVVPSHEAGTLAENICKNMGMTAKNLKFDSDLGTYPAPQYLALFRGTMAVGIYVSRDPSRLGFVRLTDVNCISGGNSSNNDTPIATVKLSE